ELVVIVLVPLAIIVTQIAVGATGGVANSAYKLWFLFAPLVYCRLHGISISRDLCRWQNWRSGLAAGWLLGAVAAAIFPGAYSLWGDDLADKPAVAGKIQTQFGVHAATVFLIAPFTIVINSLVEEFFYRAFAFRLLATRNGPLGMLLPAAVFTAQHLLFIYHW